MDSITHIALGACIGEVVLHKKLGKKALLWGAIAQNIPDIDSIANLFFSTDKALLIHRGITHSLLFAIVVGFALAFLAKRIHHKVYLSFALLAFFFCLQLVVHDVLDTCNSYGTGLLEPFSHHRFSFNLLYVADPLFTISLLVALIVLITLRSNNLHRGSWAYWAMAISALYLVFAGFNKSYIDDKVEVAIKQQSINAVSYFTTPAPFNCMLWYVVVKADSGYYTAYHSSWDKSGSVMFTYNPINKHFIKSFKSDTLNNLIAFSGGNYTITKTNAGLYFNILRFGQVQGWANSNAPFAFSYPLAAVGNETLLLQKGRISGWNEATFKNYISRIAGHENLNSNLPPTKP